MHFPTPIFLALYVSGTMEYCTVCSANSSVAGPGSGMIGLYLLLFCFATYRSYQTFCLTQSFMSPYYSGCSHEQTRDRLAGDARVADLKTSRRLPRMIYMDILPVSLVVTTLGISSVPFLLFFLREF